MSNSPLRRLRVPPGTARVRAARPWLSSRFVLRRTPAIAGPPCRGRRRGALALTGCTPHIGAKCNAQHGLLAPGHARLRHVAARRVLHLLQLRPRLVPERGGVRRCSTPRPGLPVRRLQLARAHRPVVCLQQCHKDSDCRDERGLRSAPTRGSPRGTRSSSTTTSRSSSASSTPRLLRRRRPTRTPAVASIADAAAVCQPTGPIGARHRRRRRHVEASRAADAAGD